MICDILLLVSVSVLPNLKAFWVFECLHCVLEATFSVAWLKSHLVISFFYLLLWSQV